MRLSTKSRYGLRILLQIALDTKTQKSVKGRLIAKKQSISEPYLEQIMIPLKNSGIVRTIRGCNGGYTLNALPSEVTVLTIIELFEGKIQLVKCKDESGNNCERIDICHTTSIWEGLSKIIRSEAGKITLASIIKEVEKGINVEYVI